MRFPWLSERWESAERRAVEAETGLLAARVQQGVARSLANEALEIKKINGFTEAIRVAMGVRQ